MDSAVNLPVSFVTIGLQSIAFLIVSAFVYQQTRKRDASARLTEMNDLHDRFWTDPDFSTIRAAIANDENYAPLEAVLKKRVLSHKGEGGSQSISPDEYKMIDLLDKFINFMIRADQSYARLERKGSWENLFFEFWISAIVERRRHHIWWYVEQYYGTVHDRSQIIKNVRADPTHGAFFVEYQERFSNAQ